MYRTRITSLIGIFMLVSMLMGITFSISFAQEPLSDVNSVTKVEDDGGTAEVAVEWITDWPGTADDRANWYYSANNLYNQLRDGGWIGRFNWGNTNAWERDFKAAAYSGNGDIDTVDLAMIGTHGTGAWDPKWSKNLSAVYFSSNNDDWFLSPGEAYRYYGTNDLEWLAFDSCSVLRDDSMWYWHETFNGLHLMMGFANTMYVVYPGDGGVWGDQMRKKGWWIFGHDAKTVTQAWFTAVEDQQPSGVRGRVLAETLDNYNDYLWGQGYVSQDYSNNGAYWYWDHVSGTPKPLQIAAVPAKMQIYSIMPRIVDTNYVSNIGSVFNLTDTQKILPSPDGSAIYMVGGISDTKQLRVDAFTGGYLYQDLGELWTKPEMLRELPPSDGRAESIAESFLRKNGEGLPGGYYDQYHQIITPTVELEGPSNGLDSVTRIAAATPTTPTNYMISYARSLDDGNGQQVSVVGPGARLNVYIGDGSVVIGLKGGWRSAVPKQQVNRELGTTTAVSVTIKAAEQAWSDFLANPGIALAQPPQALTYTQKLTPTLAYYEQTLSITQTELIPAWVFVADLFTGTNVITDPTILVAGDVNIYVPASAEPDALPQANIIDPVQGTQVISGQSVTLNGEASAGTAPYMYQWSSSIDGVLGSGPSLSTNLTLDLHNNQTQPNHIMLTVIDANGLVSVDSVDVTVLTQVYLPLVLK